MKKPQTRVRAGALTGVYKRPGYGASAHGPDQQVGGELSAAQQHRNRLGLVNLGNDRIELLDAADLGVCGLRIKPVEPRAAGGTVSDSDLDRGDRDL